MEWRMINLISSDEKQYLKQIVKENSTNGIPLQVLDALVFHRILNINYQLTFKGRNLAISLFSLTEQCSLLRIPLEVIHLNYSGKPEYAALNFYRKRGYIGVYSEGVFFKSLLKSIFIEGFKNYNVFQDYEDVIVRELRAQAIITKNTRKKILDSVTNIDNEELLNIFLFSIEHPAIKSFYPGLTENIQQSIALFKSIMHQITLDDFKKILEIIYQDPDLSFGWPDLTIFKDGEICQLVWGQRLIALI